MHMGSVMMLSQLPCAQEIQSTQNVLLYNVLEDIKCQ